MRIEAILRASPVATAESKVPRVGALLAKMAGRSEEELKWVE